MESWSHIFVNCERFGGDRVCAVILLVPCPRWDVKKGKRLTLKTKNQIGYFQCCAIFPYCFV